MPAPYGLTVSDFLYNDGNITRVGLSVGVTLPSDGRIRYVEYQYKTPSDPDFVALDFTASVSTELKNIPVTEFTVRARTVDDAGNRSAWSAELVYQAQGKLAPPDDVASLSVQVNGETAQLSWPKVTSLDLSHYWIRHSPNIAGATWEDVGAVELVGSTVGTVVTVPMLGGTYMVKAVDTSGKVSVNAAAAVENAPPPITNLVLVSPFVGTELEVSWISSTTKAKVEIVRLGVVRYQEIVEGTSFKLTASVGYDHNCGRAFDVRVTAIDGAGNLASSSVTLAVSNPAPATPNNVVINPVIDGLFVTADIPADTGIKNLKVWGSTSSGFGIADSTLLETSSRAGIVITTDQALYLKFAFTDAWDDSVVGLNFTGEFTATPAAASVGPNSITETEIADDSISTPKLKANSVLAGNISVNDLAALSANLGTVTGGTFRTDALDGSRVEISAAGTYPFWIGNGAKTPGNASLYYDKILNKLWMSGELVAATGTFAGNLSAAGGTFNGTLVGVNGDFSGSLSGATGTYSGTLTASAVNAVNTINIAGNAVTIPAFGKTDGATTLTTSYQTAASAPIASAGGDVMLHFTAYCEVNGGGDEGSTYPASIDAAFYRAGTLIYSRTLEYSPDTALVKGAVSMAYRDTGATGTHTYYVKLKRSSTTGAGGKMSYRNLMLLGVLR
ncbi:MAG: hypothetical protein V7739_11000 [Motiliproteus sp.]